MWTRTVSYTQSKIALRSQMNKLQVSNRDEKITRGFRLFDTLLKFTFLVRQIDT